MADNSLEWFSYYGKKYSPLIRKLTDKQRSDFVLAIDALFTTGELIQLDPVTDMVFSLAFEDFKDSQMKKDKKSETNRNNVNNRWHKGNAHPDDDIPSNTDDTTVYGRIPSNTDDTNDTQYRTEQYKTEQTEQNKEKYTTHDAVPNVMPEATIFPAIPEPYKPMAESEFEKAREQSLAMLAMNRTG